MHRKTRITLIVTAILLTTVALSAWGARSIQRNMVVVRVHEAGGTNVSISLPGALLSTAIRLTPAQVFDEHHHELEELNQILPMLETFQSELAKLPDCELVVVESADESVRVAKDMNRLVVQVDSHDEHVYVAFPLGMMSAVVDKLEAIERRRG